MAEQTGTYSGASHGTHRISAAESVRREHMRRSERSSMTDRAAPVVPELAKGDMVQHTAFGRGMVLTVLKMGGDALLEIAFDQVGTKKLMANTAAAHMKKL